MASIDVDGARLRYERSGSGPRTLAFFHGWCSRGAHWDAQAAWFAPAHTVLRWDRRGMGESVAAPAGTARRHADDLVALLDAEGLDRAVVVGHAGGGPSALTFAAEHPGRTDALILVDTSLHDPADERSARFADSVTSILDRLAGPDAEPFFRGLYASYFGPRADAALVAAAVDGAWATDAEVRASELRQMVQDTAAVAARVTCPVLWVSAMPGDTASVRRAFSATRPVIGHVVGSGHFVQVEVPEQLNAMIDAFLGTLPAA